MAIAILQKNNGGIQEHAIHESYVFAQVDEYAPSPPQT
jgi:hypothetical protein